MSVVDVVIPTRGGQTLARAVESLTFLPFPIRLHVIVGKPFIEAVNEGLYRARGDVLLMDDDVVLLPDTFRRFSRTYESADAFGFKLVFPDGRIQHAGGFLRGMSAGHLGYGQQDHSLFDTPYYVAHATSALVYYKRDTYKQVGFYDEAYTSGPLSDLDYSLRILRAGMHIRYLPYTAIHDEKPKDAPEKRRQITQNLTTLQQKHLIDADFRHLAESFPKEVIGT